MEDGDNVDAAVARLLALETKAADLQERLAQQATTRSQALSNRQPSLARMANEQDAKEVLRLADLNQPVGFDGAGMWKAIKSAFHKAEVRHDAAAVPSEADIKAVVALVKAARQMTVASAYLWNHHRTGGAAVALRLGLLHRNKLSPSAAAAAEFFWQSPVSTICFEKAAKEAVTDLDRDRRNGATSPRLDGEPAAAWLITEALPTVAKEFLGIEPTFGEDTATARRSACVRFIQAAFSVTKREPPTDAMIVQTAKRAKVARRAKGGPAEVAAATGTRATKSKKVSK